MNLLRSLFRRKKIISILILILVIFPFLGLAISEVNFKSFKNEINHKLMKNSRIQENLIIKSHESLPFIKHAAIEETSISYLNQYESTHNVTSNELTILNTTIASEVEIESAPYHSEFYVNSEVSNNETIWYNGQEEGYGDVNISKQFTTETPYYRFNFSENAETPASGVSNINYNIISIPSPYNYSTTVSFEFRIPWMDAGLTNNVHSLVLELRFNNASINFVLSDNGSSLGSPLEPNVFKPSTNSLYILCNQSLPAEWSILNYNISRLITSYFSFQEYSNFAIMKTLFCYMFAFLPEYSVTLDLRSFDYNTSIPAQVPTTYQMAGLTVFSPNGSLKYDFQTGNFTLLILDNTSWKKNLITYFSFSLTRKIEFKSFPKFNTWNISHLNVCLQIYFPFSLSKDKLSVVYLNLPFDWMNINILNSSVILEKGRLLNLFSGLLQGYEYFFYLQNISNLVLQALVPNYLANVSFPTDLSYNDNFQVTGDLINPLLGSLQFYIYNETVFLHQTTLPMLNGSFIFPVTSISNKIPSGVMKILINWSCGYEFGMYEQLICIHPLEDDLSLINILTSLDYELYQYDSFFTNLSLSKDGYEYVEESATVYFLIDDFIYPFSRSQGAYYTLMIDHVIWEAGKYNGTIIASDGANFFAKNQVTITIYSADIDWHIEGLPEIAYRENDINIRIIAFASPLDGGTTWPVPGVEFAIWINNTEINRSVTNFEGYIDIIIPSIYFNRSFSIIVTVLCELEAQLVKLQSYDIPISNDSIYIDRELTALTEISQTPVISNHSFFRIFNITYPKNSSQWYTILEGIDSNPISVYLLRNDFVLEITNVGAFLIWNLQSDSTNNDILVLEFSGPLTYYSIHEETAKYLIHIECYTNYSISNYTFQLDLNFIKFPIIRISLLDFLKHNITDKFDLEIEGSIVFLRNLNIISGIKANYYLEVEITIPTIEILNNFKESYSYKEEIVGKWRFCTYSNFSYRVYYSVTGSFRSECKNTSIFSFLNHTYTVEAHLPKLKWNSTVFVEMELNFNRGAISSCASQNYTVTDPYPPNSSYFLVFKKEFIDLHVFPFEPELGSGIKSIRLISGQVKFNLSLISVNHYYSEFSKDLLDPDNISILIIDRAGNVQSTNIDIRTDSLANIEGISPTTFIPSLIACTLISVYLLTKALKRRRNLIL